jgi:hypothetical protein
VLCSLRFRFNQYSRFDDEFIFRERLLAKSRLLLAMSVGVRGLLAHLDSRLNIDTKRTRRPTVKATAVSILFNLTPLALARCFATAIEEAPAIYHSSSAELPPEPIPNKRAMVHIFAAGWMDAEHEEYKAHEDNATWSPSVSRPEGTFALPTKWVYNYEFDQAGKLGRLMSVGTVRRHEKVGRIVMIFRCLRERIYLQCGR